MSDAASPSMSSLIFPGTNASNIFFLDNKKNNNIDLNKYINKTNTNKEKKISNNKTIKEIKSNKEIKGINKPAKKRVLKKYNSTTNILSYELILSSKGEYTFYYLDNETGINNQINDTVKVVTDYTDLFIFTKIPDECNFGYYEIVLENIGIKNEHFGRINTKNS